ncbi:Hypothetical predicted protein [Marmota monax]|uniref:Uncharacterized protein n=1 Tax=Marmota monax TaxID=9995 RepID=A0A5E4C0B9_MARMO|nr:hypothetical protein GHT09_001382 [Marmota monax]VTJ75333.1 Hypothetical predicted protein [Marmota monax]
MGSLLDGIPRKYFNISTDHSQSLKSNPHTTENCLLHPTLFFEEEKEKHMHKPQQMAAQGRLSISARLSISIWDQEGQTSGSSSVLELWFKTWRYQPLPRF